MDWIHTYIYACSCGAQWAKEIWNSEWYASELSISHCPHDTRHLNCITIWVLHYLLISWLLVTLLHRHLSSRRRPVFCHYLPIIFCLQSLWTKYSEVHLALKVLYWSTELIYLHQFMKVTSMPMQKNLHFSFTNKFCCSLCLLIFNISRLLDSHVTFETHFVTMVTMETHSL
jgi:hypothetical protein